MAKAERSRTRTGDLSRRLRIIAGQEVLFDSEEFLWEPEDWSEQIARTLAREAGLEQMTEIHWNVITFLRHYFFENGRSPLNRPLKKGVGMSLMELENLFPGGIKLGARRIAGLPNPKSCS
ncbi:MAG: TusE/DsrC/DsvC family sulfur relay protein [Acidobacteriota bacterium]